MLHCHTAPGVLWPCLAVPVRNEHLLPLVHLKALRLFLASLLQGPQMPLPTCHGQVHCTYTLASLGSVCASSPTRLGNCPFPALVRLTVLQGW